MRQGIPLVVSAPSGSGKSTLCARLLEKCPSLSYSVSCTTRTARPDEINGRDYHFLTVSEFEQKREKGEFAEWAIVHGNFYGTPLAPLHGELQKGRDILFDIDVQGAAQLRAALPQARLVFILPPSLEELGRRLAGRGTESGASVQTRLQNASAEMRAAFWYDYIVVNDILDKALSELLEIYHAATRAVTCNRDLVGKILANGKLP